MKGKVKGHEGQGQYIDVNMKVKGEGSILERQNEWAGGRK
jgi:hypothetical protein